MSAPPILILVVQLHHRHHQDRRPCKVQKIDSHIKFFTDIGHTVFTVNRKPSITTAEQTIGQRVMGHGSNGSTKVRCKRVLFTFTKALQSSDTGLAAAVHAAEMLTEYASNMRTEEEFARAVAAASKTCEKTLWSLFYCSAAITVN